MPAYEVILHERAWVALAATKSTERKRLLAFLDGLKADPFRRGDFQQRDATGRIYEVILMDEWLATLWSDHGVTQIHVVNLERVED